MLSIFFYWLTHDCDVQTQFVKMAAEEGNNSLVAAIEGDKPVAVTEVDVPPNHTLYAQNLNEKIKLEG
jgi:hypothetical protein